MSTNEPASAADITGFATGTLSTSGFVRAKRNGTGGARIYSFTYVATDRAGNATSCTASVTVPHDRRPSGL